MKLRRGMTLVEILFAFAIIGTVLTLSYAASLRAWRTAVSANQRTQAQAIVQSEIDQIKAAVQTDSIDWSDFVSGSKTSFVILMSNPDGSSITNWNCADASGCAYKRFGAPIEVRATGDNASTPDATRFNLSVKGVNQLVQVASGGGQTTEPQDITATATGPVVGISFTARVDWVDANGTPDNLQASSIITQPGL